jgi:hypothetical protein
MWLSEEAMDVVATTAAPADDIDRAFKTYVSLPQSIDLRLTVDGMQLRTSDFSCLLQESAGIDLGLYFKDAFKDIEHLSVDEKEKLSQAVARLFATISGAICGKGGVLVDRSERSTIPLPPIVTQGFVQELLVEQRVQFTLRPALVGEIHLANISGITLNAGGKVLSLNKLFFHERNGKCLVKPYFEDRGSIPRQGRFRDHVIGTLKDILVSIMVKAPVLSFQLPVAVEDFSKCLSEVNAFLAFVHDARKDILMFGERVAGAAINDPLITALLSHAKRLARDVETIELERERESNFDLGGPSLKLAPKIQFIWRSATDELLLEKITGVELALPFEPPAEWQAIGIDLGRTIPKTITSIKLARPDENRLRRLVAETGPGCWLSVDLGTNMLPAQDANGNWVIFGAASNPISGMPQRFFVRFDKDNNLNMTPREIAQVVTQTASEGFDPNDPATWRWAAVAIGGSTLLAAADKEGPMSEKIKAGARKLGRIIGKLINEI